MDGDFHGAFEILKNDVNRSFERISDVIKKIGTMSGTVRHNADAITTGAQDLYQRAEQQASSLERAIATTETMTATIKANAKSSSSASELAASASDRAEAGGDVVKQAISAMSDIETSAKKIADIMAVIDEIAFQTNLLALNASVEAARAGEAGKGFAVVASEVRALAQRSSGASQDIRQLIQLSTGQVGEGVRLVTQTGESLAGIATSIAQVEDAIRDIASSSNEQSSNVDDMSSAVSQIDQLTQQNSSIAQQSASNSRTLLGSAQELEELIGVFKATDMPR